MIFRIVALRDDARSRKKDERERERERESKMAGKVAERNRENPESMHRVLMDPPAKDMGQRSERSRCKSIGASAISRD
jgi:hypothetical protein